MSSPVVTLWTEEVKAAMRGRFAWLGAAFILFSVGCLATVATQDTWLDGYGIIAYCLIPLAFIPLAAGFIASPRANRFVESVFTAPVERRDWLIAKFLVLLVLAAGYYIALLPMFAVYAAHVGVPALLESFLIWCPCLLLLSIAIGALIGVLFIGRSLAAPAGAGMGVLLFYAGLLPLQELMVARNNGATRMGHLTLASPAVLLKNGLGFTLAAARVPATTAWTWFSVVFVFVLSIGLAVWVFLRAQGVETWETTGPQRWIIALALIAMVVVPVAVADTNYDNPAPPANQAPAVRALFARAGSSLALVDTGEPAPVRCCGTILNRDADALGTDEPNKRDLLVLLPAETDRKIIDASFRATGESGLEIETSPSQTIETRVYPNESGPTAADGHHIQKGWVARVPVTLTPRKPWDIGGNRYPLTVQADYRVDGDPQPHKFSGRAAVEAQVGSGIYEMGAASLILPLICLGAAVRRWRVTR